MSKWHIENVLAALRSALRLLDAVLDALDGPEKKPFASLSSKLQEAEGELVKLRDASPSEQGPAVPSEGSKPGGSQRSATRESPADDEEDTPNERPPRP